MKHVLTRTALAVSLLTLAACGGQDIQEYAGKAPGVSVQKFYGQPMAGYGIFQDGSGQVTDRYYATLVPQWNGNEGTLVEKQWNEKGKLFFTQTWHIHAGEDGRHFTATATSINGQVSGETVGYAMHMQYNLAVPREDGSNVNVDADDWTYLQPDGSGINKVAMHKLGLHVGNVTYDLRPVTKAAPLHTGYGAASK